MDNQNTKRNVIKEQWDVATMMPREFNKRSLTAKGLVAIWFAMAICVSLFTQSAELYTSLSVGQIIIVLFIAHTLLCVIMWFTQDFGIRYGIPFSMSLTPSFGYIGKYIPTFARAIPGCFWFGFQTYLGADAINALTELVWDYDNLMLWIILLAIAQVLHTCFGIKAVSRLSNLSSPLLLFVGICLLYLLLTNNHVSFGEILKMHGEGGNFNMMGAVLMYIGGWATLAASISDITRECVTTEEESKHWWASTKKFMLAQWIGLVPATVLFGGIGAIGMALTGEWNPIRIMVYVIGADRPIMMVLCLLFVILATWATNDTGNLYPAAYAVASLAPTKVKFWQGVIVAGIIGIAMRPWAAAGNVTTITVFIGCMLAPVIGIMIVDYYILRKRKIKVEDLYKMDGQYQYWHNINPAAIIAMAVGVIASLPLWNYVFFVGILVGGFVYYILMKYWICKIYNQEDIQ